MTSDEDSSVRSRALTCLITTATAPPGNSSGSAASTFDLAEATPNHINNNFHFLKTQQPALDSAPSFDLSVLGEMNDLSSLDLSKLIKETNSASDLHADFSFLAGHNSLGENEFFELVDQIDSFRPSFAAFDSPMPPHDENSFALGDSLETTFQNILLSTSMQAEDKPVLGLGMDIDSTPVDLCEASLMSSAESESEKPGRRGKKYARRVETMDKKLSNKEAATRYRSKKLRQREALFVQVETVAKENAAKRKNIEDLQTEISFIKSLLVQALLAKNK